MPWNAIGFRTAFEAASGTLFGLVPLPEARLERHSVWYHTLGGKLWYQAQWGSSGRLRGGTKRDSVPEGGSVAVCRLVTNRCKSCRRAPRHCMRYLEVRFPQQKDSHGQHR